MIKQFFIMAKRNLLNNKSLSLLNITCLAIGMASLLITLNYVRFEFSYDKFNKNADKVFKVTRDVFYPDASYIGIGYTPGPLGPTVKAKCPEVDDYTRIYYNINPSTISYKNNKFIEKAFNVHWVENSFLTMFDCLLLKGDINALQEPMTVVLTESIAKKYFGKEEPMGKSIMFDNDLYRITGICADPPINTHFHYKYLLSYNTLINHSSGWAHESWDVGSSFYLYLKIKPGSDLNTLAEKIKNLNPNSRRDAQLERLIYHLVPITDIHLQGSVGNQLEENGNIKMVRFILIVGIFFLLISIVNFINLSTSKSIERAKEVGIRKVAGAFKINLIYQFLAENFLINIIALVIAIIILIISPSLLKNILSNYNFSPIEILRENWIFIFILLIVSVVLSGLYPAFILSSYKPISVLRGKLATSTEGVKLRKYLIVFQFIVAVALIAGIITIRKQMNYMRSKHLGFDMNQILIVNSPQSESDSSYRYSLSYFKRELLSYSQINSVALSTEIPGKPITYNRGVTYPDFPDHMVGFKRNFVDYSFLDVYGMKLLAGRNFRAEIRTDNRAVIINETGSKNLLFKNPTEAIDKIVNMAEQGNLKIIGVVADYHQESLNHMIIPVAMVLDQNARSYISIRLNVTDIQSTISIINNLWKKTFPHEPFDHYFLNDFYNQQYITDMQFRNFVNFFSILLIIVICIGLWGISSYSISVRTKEIGVRRVLNASSSDIGLLLFNVFYMLILIASVVSLPLAYIIFDKWLSNYAYKISIGWWFFVFPILLVTIITVLSIGYGIFKAINIKPVNALKYE